MYSTTGAAAINVAGTAGAPWAGNAVGLGQAGFQNAAATPGFSLNQQNFMAPRRLGHDKIDAAFNQLKPLPTKQPEIQKMSRRLVQVMIADIDDNIPLDMMLLYKGEPKLTDGTDQELFFEVDINTVLAEHNANRVGIADKAVKERIVYLEPARIRDLKMVVVTLATF